MNKTGAILLSVVAIVVVVILVTLIGADNYGSFAEAKLSPDKNFTIIGVLNKEKAIEYNPDVDANRTSFYLIDKNGEENLVIYHEPKPRDIEQSEEITLEGKMIKGEFHATHLLMKCPSKYTPEEIKQKGLENNTY